ncbi:wax ester/triacylglycerol synthase domain-containing protein [Actinosynnema sp. NPDC053489]|uniref:wax ester/triacylglycerol synthase domain-containing protein n=1 Tax=Actinosynnema sp. NPDC053489 TaxID=3363916 RepID=UPI0037CB4D01
MRSDRAPGTAADFLATSFAGLGRFAPDPTDLVIGLVFRAAGPCPPVDAVRQRVASRLDRLSPLTERLVVGEGVRWEPDPDFDLAHHVRELPRQDGVAPARAVFAGSFDPARPPWGLWISDNGSGTWDAYYLVHHARQDAGAAARTVVALLGDDEPAPWRRTVRRRSWLHGWPGAVSLLPDLLRTRRAAEPAPRWPVGEGRVLSWAAVPVGALKQVAKRTGATVNQVHLAALADALAGWLPEVPRRQVCLPVETRRTGEPHDDFANRIGLVRVALPCGAGTPGGRLHDVVASVSRARTARHRRAWRDVSDNASARVAGRVLALTTDPAQVGVTVSSIRIAGPLDLMGARVLDVTAIPWLPPGHTCFALLVGYGDEVRLSVLAPEGAPDPSDLTRSWVQAVHALAGPDEATAVVASNMSDADDARS